MSMAHEIFEANLYCKMVVLLKLKFNWAVCNLFYKPK